MTKKNMKSSKKLIITESQFRRLIDSTMKEIDAKKLTNNKSSKNEK